MNNTTTEQDVILQIVERVNNLFPNRFTPSRLTWDIAAAHQSCPLNLDALLNADQFNFLHDVFGIIQNLNRETGKLENCFLPRFTKRA